MIRVTAADVAATIDLFDRIQYVGPDPDEEPLYDDDDEDEGETP